MRVLDSQDAEDQAWVQFRIGIAAATALRILIQEFDDAAPAYFVDLRGRLADALSQGEVWMDHPPDDEPWDGTVPLQAPFERPGVTFLPWRIAWAMENHLFPNVATDDDHLWLFRAAVCLQLHAALESYAKTRGFQRGSLADFIRDSNPKFPAVIDEQLRELDATRQVFAHAGGVADATYDDRTPRRKVLVGERRPLTDAHLEKFADAVWRSALALVPEP